MLNSASTTQWSCSGPTMRASALAPKTRDKAPSRMDLPAPVSPLIIIKPSGNVVSRELIRI